MTKRMFGILLFLIGLLNVADYFFTVKALELGGREANPIMLLAIEANEWMFPVVKLALVPLALIAVWLTEGKSNVAVFVATWIVFLSYTAVTLWHIRWIYF